MKFTKSLSAIVMVFISLLAVNGYSQSFLTNGLVAYYPFNGNADDASGNSHDGTVYAGVELTNGVVGMANSAYWFAGQTWPNPYGSIQASNVNLAGSSLSVSLWFKRDYDATQLNSDGHGHLFDLGSAQQSGQTFHIAIDYKGAAIRFSFWNDDFDVTAPKVGVGKWSHMVGTFDSQTMVRSIYIDGILVATNKAHYGFNGDGVLSLTGGGQVGYSGQAHPARLDDVRFYNRVLSASEVSQLYAIESGPILNVRKAVYLDSTNLWIGTNYQLQVSSDMSVWTNHGAPFTATNTSMVYPQYFDVENWGQLFFQLKAIP